MTQAEILAEFQRLSMLQQLEIIKATVHIFEQRLREQVKETTEKLPLAKAAEALLKDYEDDEELTIFSSLDGEAFYAEK